MWESDLIKRLQNIIRDYEEIIVVLSFAILLGFINGIVDARILGGTYFQNMFRPNFYQILERLVFIIISLFFGIIWYQLNKKRKEQAKDLIDYTVQLEDSNRQKELFTDIMRHDLINPIGIILNVLELMEDNDSPEDMQEELKMIKRNANKAHEMIEIASKYAKLKSVDELELTDSDLSDIINDSIEDLKNLADEKKIMIESNLEGSYPTKVNPFIEDVFSNLISNAIKYSPENSKILIDSREDEEDYIISVKDFGEGISDENKENIFHRFERAAKEGIKGFGLGLSIVKMIMDLHNGRVWVEDNPEGGSIFYVRIPKAK